MKLLLTSFLMLLLPSAIMAMGTEEDNYIHDCQVQYSISLGASYKDENQVPSCSEVEMGAIHDLAVSVVQQDFISALLGTTLPEFILGWESYEAGTFITNNAPLPSPNEIAEGMSAEDIQSDLFYAGCGRNDPFCEKLNKENEDGDEEKGEGRRHLLELTPEEPKAEREWTPITHLHDKNRHLQKFDCPTSRGDCRKKTWCCNWCSFCGRRRRHLKKNLNGCTTVRTKREHDKAEETELETIKRFERRVSKELTSKLKGLARKGAMHVDPKSMQVDPIYTCLGLPHLLKVDFDRHFFEESC